MDSKSFREFAEDEMERAYPPISGEEANKRAADRILEGYLDISDAGHDADLLERQDAIRYDGYGWSFGADTVRWAIWVKTAHLFPRYTKGTRIEVACKASVQYWGRPGKKGTRKSSRKEAIKSGNPYIYVWFHNSDYTEESWKWLPVKIDG